MYPKARGLHYPSKGLYHGIQPIYPHLRKSGIIALQQNIKEMVYGKQQMQEAVRRIIAQGAKKIIVTTNEILIPAQRTYESAGFKFINKCEEPNNEGYAGMRINYEIIVK